MMVRAVTLILLPIVLLLVGSCESNDGSPYEGSSAKQADTDSLNHELEDTLLQVELDTVVPGPPEPVLRADWCEAELYVEENHPDHNYPDEENMKGVNPNDSSTLKFRFDSFFPQACDILYHFQKENCAQFRYSSDLYIESLYQGMMLEANTSYDSISVSMFAKMGLTQSGEDAREMRWDSEFNRFVFTPDVLLATSRASNTISFKPSDETDKAMIRALKSLEGRVSGADGGSYNIFEWTVFMDQVHLRFEFFTGADSKQVVLNFMLLKGGC